MNFDKRSLIVNQAVLLTHLCNPILFYYPSVFPFCILIFANNEILDLFINNEKNCKQKLIIS